MTPVAGLMDIPSGADKRLNEGGIVGRSGSENEQARTRADSSSMIWSPGALNTGAPLFTSWTITLNPLISTKGSEPLSVTCTAMRLVLGPCSSVGVQVRTPVTGSKVTPFGAAVRLKVSAVAELSAATAVFVAVSVVNSSIV